MADYFGRRFNSQRLQTAAGITIIFGLGGYLLAVTQGAAFLLTMASSRDSSANFRRASVSKTVLETTFERFDADKGGLGLWRPAAWSARTHAPARC